MTRSIPKSFISDLLNQCDIITLINHFVPLRKQGTRYVAHCPFHEEKTASFSVSETKQLYHCFGCKASGNALNFVISYEKLDFLTAVEWLANYLKIKIPYQTSHQFASTNEIESLYNVLEDATCFYQQQLFKTPAALDYLKKRGLTLKSIEHFRLGFASTYWDSLLKFLVNQKQYALTVLKTAGLVVQKNQFQAYDRFRARIVFPIRDKQGRCIGLGGRVLDKLHTPKYLNSPETPLFHKNQALYGLYESLTHRKSMKQFWIVEGYMDTITLHQFGITETVATLGTATSRFHVQQLFRLTEEIVFCFDGDLAGEKAATRALELILPILQDTVSVRFLKLPLGEDPDSWVKKHAVNAEEHLRRKTVSLEDFLFQTVQKDTTLNTMEGQRTLLKKAMPLVKRIPKSIRREQIFQRLSRLVNIETDKLQSLLLRDSFKSVAHSLKANTYSALDRIMGLLMQYPQVLSSHLSTINPSIHNAYPLLHTLIEKVQKNPKIHTAALLEQFRDDSALEKLSLLAYYDWLVPSSGVVEEFCDILIHLNKLIQNKTIQALIQKARQNLITQEEKQTLTKLLREREKLAD